MKSAAMAEVIEAQYDGSPIFPSAEPGQDYYDMLDMWLKWDEELFDAVANSDVGLPPIDIGEVL
jgi:hypothetical protein